MVFEDRVAKYPGRWTMVKSDGTSEIVTLIRNDEPTKKGTPINAATLNELSTVAGAINAKEEAVSAASTAQTAATSADQSAQAASENAGKAESSAASAKASADKAATIVSTDKTLTVEGAPADAKATGDALNARYTKEEVDALLQNVNPFPVGSIFQTVSLASPALTFGGTWSELDAGTAELPVKNMHIWERMGYLLNVRAIAGSALTITDGKTTVEDTVDASGRYARELPSTGTWTVTATVGSDVRTQTCAVDKYGVYTVELDWKIFGVVWDYGKPSTALTRLTKASDPHHFVTADITTEPVPVVGTDAGSSPFDSYMPWSGMEEYNVIDGAVGAKQGATAFSRSNDTVVRIPEFFYDVVDDADGQKRYFYISDKPRSEFEKHPGSGRYVGRYQTGSGYSSKTGLAPLTNIYRSTFRANSMAKGAGWYQYDYVTLCAIWLLYIIEYADWDSQSKIGKGRSSSLDTYLNSGNTDTMVYHTGRSSGTDGYTAVQYRHIENLWGNVITNLDGISFNGELLYACLDPSKFADSTTEGYIYVGTVAKTSGFISKLGVSASAPWSFYATETNGSSSTYIPDQFGYDGSGWKGSNTGSGTDGRGGLFGIGSCAYTNKWTSIGSRLIFVPQD